MNNPDEKIQCKDIVNNKKISINDISMIFDVLLVKKIKNHIINN